MLLTDKDRELGAEVLADGVRFRVWAPKRKTVEAVLDNGKDAIVLEPEENGYFSGFARGVGPGMLYRYRLDGEKTYPDPASRFQPDGPHGPSRVVEARSYEWNDEKWRGFSSAKGQVLYELHVGAFTREGTYAAAAAQLAELKTFGITAIELMPLAECPGRWNWGYDGVGLYAPFHAYGEPDDLKRFVDAAHGAGLGVILDVVYNHIGPDGNYFREFSDDYFTDRYRTDWGEAINYDGPGSQEVREFFIHNAAYWISEFHFDGLRLDATQNIYDSNPPETHIVAEIARAARLAAAGRGLLIYAENEPQDARLARPIVNGGYGLDGIWIDDFHHAARVSLTGRREAYFTDYRGEAQEFVSLAKRGSLFQGQRYEWQKAPRGAPTETDAAEKFVFYLQNHDQVANTLSGRRPDRISSPGRYRALTALWLLAPETPLFFMGQEFGTGKRFLFFADHGEGLAAKVHQGRREFLSQFPSHASPEALATVPDPAAPETFYGCKLDFSERQLHEPAYRLHRDLLAIRRDDPVIAAQDRFAIDGAVLGAHAFVLRWGGDKGDRLLAVNLGADLHLSPAPEPLLAPPPDGAWAPVWSSNDARYQGAGFTNPSTERGWLLPGESAVFFRGMPAGEWEGLPQ